jgi:2-amino-4-hydroxy-6-hydroxymethyldihydropteridine diphosphokinase
MSDGSFAAVLRALRLSRGMSLRELGRRITYDYSHLSRIESGKSVPSAGVAEKVDDLSNLGDQEANLRKALDGLADDLVKVSGSCWTPPWGDPDQPEYLNAVVLVDDDTSPDGWLELAHELERSAAESATQNAASAHEPWTST